MEIEARGYASNVEDVNSRAGKPFKKYSLGVKQKEKAYKDKPETVTWANFRVVDLSGADVQDKSYVTVKGQLKVREFLDKTTGAKRQSLEIITSSVDVAPPLDGQPQVATKAKPTKAPEREPWDDDDSPF